MTLVYVAGPYRAASEWAVVQNIRRAEAVALMVWKMGAACICPHKNTAMFGGAADDSVWLDGDLEILRRCDAVVCAPHWQESEGVKREVEFARMWRIPVFETTAKLGAWLEKEEGRKA